jgi:hypothetical protein
VEAVLTRTLALARAEVILAGLLAAASALVIVVLAPPGGDGPAHLYRTLLVEDGVWLWDELWFAGHYPLASYSVLYYLPAALVGNVPLVVAAVVASAALFAALAEDEWGDAARWPSRAFGVAAAWPLYTGTYSYALGLAFALACLRLLQLRRPRAALLAAGLSLAASPLAFAFLLLALAAVALDRGRRSRLELGVGAGLVALAALQLALLSLFPDEGRYPYSRVSLAGAIGVAGLGAALALRAERARVLAAFFALVGLANMVAFFVATPFGDNLTRVRGVIFPLVLLTALLARFRPRPLAVAALGLALFLNVAPDLLALPKRSADAPTAREAFWRPALDFAAARSGPNYRVEVVPTLGHWEAYWVPRSGLALARGWYRQIDLAESPELYRDPLSPTDYRAWLRRQGVRFALVPEARLGAHGAADEAELLHSGAAGLRPVFRTADWTVYELPGATPILTGPGRPELLRLEHDRVEGRTTAAGTHRLRVRWTPYRRVAAGDVCLARAPDGTTLLTARRPGRFALEPRFGRAPGC